MDVIIVSKTHMSNAACVGGILGNGKFVRLLNESGYNQESDSNLEVGKVYSIEFENRRDLTPPHTEDIYVYSMTYKFTFSTEEMIEYLIQKLNIKIWQGSTEKLFDGKLHWTSGGSGYISENGEIPDQSVGFWQPDRDLTRNDFNERVRYSYPIRWRNIAYVGYQTPVDTIPAGTLVRVSLARWWSPNDDEKRCYLQLSGWYSIANAHNSVFEEETDDFPF